jgi:radical SAM superfamily enzyme YgiQ (UPF0313 family)
MLTHQLVEKTQARLNIELGTVYKPHLDRLTVALAFPNTYHVGMSNLGFQTVYGLFNQSTDVVCERVFLPDPSDLDEAAQLRSGLFTLESQTPVGDFDVLAFSLSYELDYPNALKIMALSKIPERADERALGQFPLVIAGGPAATFNPEPLSPFIDAFVIGEAEPIMPDLLEYLLRLHHSRRHPASDLVSLARKDGVYVPRFYSASYNPDGTIQGTDISDGVPKLVERQWTKDLDAYPGLSVITTPDTEFSNMVLAEVSRGCGRKCRFCVAGYAYLPPRRRSRDAVLESLAEHEEIYGEHKVGLLSASVFDHPAALLISQSLAEKGRAFSISSTRADTLDEHVVEALRKGGHGTLTIAPEAGTDRLRRVINKRITDRDVFRAAEVAWSGGFRRLRLYFMVGLPTETDDDIAGIGDLAGAIASLHLWEKINVSLSCFVPKPWTPFQWYAMDTEKELEQKLTQIRSTLRAISRVEAGGESAREAVVQGVLARGDRRVGAAILARSRGNTNWRAAFRETGIDPAFYAQRERSPDEVFPWDHLDLGTPKKTLLREYRRALSTEPGGRSEQHP